MTKMISVRLSDDQVSALDRAIRGGRFPTRTAAVRALVDDLAAEEHARELSRRFREAYSAPPTADEKRMHEFADEAARRLLDDAG